MIELAEEEIAEFVAFQRVAAFALFDWRVGTHLKLVKGEIAKLPAKMEQALPDIQRDRDAPDGNVAAVAELRADITHVERRAECLPGGVNMARLYGNAGRAGDFLQQRRAPGVEMWQREAQSTHHQCDDNN